MCKLLRAGDCVRDGLPLDLHPPPNQRHRCLLKAALSHNPSLWISSLSSLSSASSCRPRHYLHPIKTKILKSKWCAPCEAPCEVLRFHSPVLLLHSFLLSSTCLSHTHSFRILVSSPPWYLGMCACRFIFQACTHTHTSSSLSPSSKNFTFVSYILGSFFLILKNMDKNKIRFSPTTRLSSPVPTHIVPHNTSGECLSMNAWWGQGECELQSWLIIQAEQVCGVWCWQLCCTLQE